MVKIWGRISSLNVRKVVWTAQETGVPFERADAGMAFGVVSTPEYQQLNPNALVPTLQDGDLVLWESNVIVRYLAARYAAGSLYPEALIQRFDAERWMDWQQTTLNRASGPAFFQWIRTAPDRRNHDIIAQSVAAMDPVLRMLETQLSRHPYMAGDQFTMADIPIGCEIHRWFGLPQERASWPQIERWYQLLLTRPATRGVLDIALS